MLLLLMLVLCGSAEGEYSVRCGEGEGISFEDAQDGVEGRYRLEWCSRAERSVAKWIVTLRADSARRPEDCLRYRLGSPQGEVHSHYEEDVKMDLNCTTACYSTSFDLIFTATCYHIKMKTYVHAVKPNSSSLLSSGSPDYVCYVYNNYSKEHFTESQAVVNVYPSGDHVKAQWFLGYVPATSYVMEMCPDDELTKPEKCTLVNENCTIVGARQTEILCRVWPPAGPYLLRLEHYAPWRSGLRLFQRLFYTTHHSKEYAMPTEPPVESAGSGALRWGVALLVLLLGAAALVALLLRRSRLAAGLRKRVEMDWRSRRARAAPAPAPPGPGARGRVLLLYARDCKPMMAVAQQLADLLQRGNHVHDLFSAETARQAARAPAEWLRRLLARRDVRVLLLQTPAADCLYSARLLQRGAGLVLEQPLLNRRAGYRAPHAGDALLQLALRLLADSAAAPHAYNKYYVATITGLEVELIRELTPLRRYQLPAAAQLLLRDISHHSPLDSSPASLDSSPASLGSPPACVDSPPACVDSPPLGNSPSAPQNAPSANGKSPPIDSPLSTETLKLPTPDPELALQLERFSRAVQDLHEYVRQKPDYLDEELIFFDYDS